MEPPSYSLDNPEQSRWLEKQEISERIFDLPICVRVCDQPLANARLIIVTPFMWNFNFQEQEKEGWGFPKGNLLQFSQIFIRVSEICRDYQIEKESLFPFSIFEYACPIRSRILIKFWHISAETLHTYTIHALAHLYICIYIYI